MKQNLSTSPEGVACVPVALTHDYRKHSHSDQCATCGHSKESHSPSPAESVPLDGPKAIRPPASGLDSSSADVPPAKTQLVPEAPFRDFHVQCQGGCDFTYPAFAVSPKKGETPFMVIASEEAAIYVTKEQCEAFFGISHAAHLAKIQALTEALQQIADWPGNLSDEAYEKKCGPNESVDRGLKITAMRSFARAALSLPSA